MSPFLHGRSLEPQASTTATPSWPSTLPVVWQEQGTAAASVTVAGRLQHVQVRAADSHTQRRHPKFVRAERVEMPTRQLQSWPAITTPARRAQRHFIGMHQQGARIYGSVSIGQRRKQAWRTTVGQSGQQVPGRKQMGPPQASHRATSLRDPTGPLGAVLYGFLPGARRKLPLEQALPILIPSIAGSRPTLLSCEDRTSRVSAVCGERIEAFRQR